MAIPLNSDKSLSTTIFAGILSHPTPGSILTTALPAVCDFSDLAPDILAALDEVLICALAHERPLALGSILNLIASPVTLNLLNNWSDYSEEAASLYEMGSALAAHPSLKKHQALSQSKAARDHFRGALEKHYLIALLSERVLLPDADPSNWMLQLRLWVLVHALVRVRRSIYLDKNLQTLATSLRMACDRDRGWLDFYFRLKPVRLGRSFAEINSRIGSLAQRDLAFPGLPNKEVLALKAAIAVSSFQDKQIPLPESSPLPIFGRSESIKPLRQQISIEIDGYDGDVLDNPEGTVKLLTQPFQESATPAQRRLSTDTVIMGTREAVLHLPWRWGCPNPFELDRLGKWINDRLSSLPTDLSAGLAFACVWIGYCTGRTAARVLDMEVSSAPSDEWRLDVKRGLLHRHPPMRKPGWLPEVNAAGWIIPSAERIDLKLPEPLIFLFRLALKQNPKACIVANFWPASCGKTALQFIDDTLAEISPRLTGSILAEALPQRVFNETQDGVLARLIASHPQTALGGAASYAQWTLETVTRLLSGTSPEAPAAKHIALGSRLAVVDRQLRQELRRVTQRVKSCRTESPILFHNAYTAYVALALLAATGTRPTKSPFESVLQFDFEEDFVYVDDKHSDAHRRGGRAVPLPKGVSSFLQKRYLPHLETLALLLDQNHPALAREIAAMSKGSPSGRIPFFFFLEADGSAWEEVSPAGIAQVLKLGWPLPDNLFRHRLSNRLRADGVDPEIIAGILGHSEWGHGTWTDTSFRSWRDDAVTSRKSLETVFRSLNFQPLRGLDAGARMPFLGSVVTTIGPEVFGEQARAEQRWQRVKAAIRQADITIHEACGERTLADLSSDELDALFERLATNGRGLPDTMGGIRIAHLMRKLERIEAATGKLLLPKKQRRVIHEAPGLFSASAPGTMRRWRNVRRSLSSFSPENPRQRLLAATVALAIECRISDPRVLADVAGNKHYRLVSFESALYLEHGDFSSNLEASCRRFRIFGRAAQWISGLPPDRAWLLKDTLPPWLESFDDELRIHSANRVGDLIRELAKFIDQVNAQTLPGVLCGVLSGRLETRSLGWRDWVRLKTGCCIDLSKYAADSPETRSAIDIDDQLTISCGKKPINVNDARQAAHDFFGVLRDFISASEKNSDKKKNPRRHLVMQLHAEIRLAQKRGVPTSAILLGAWIHDLAQPVGRRVREPSTLLRYLTALSSRFENELADFDLLNADDDDLTDAYSRLLTCKDKLAGLYEARVLAMFHRWLRRRYGVEEPDWDDLPVAVSFDVIDPGFITEEDYRTSFEHLGRHRRLNVDDRLAAQMLLFLGYRFGLRRREASGLIRKDWDDSAGKVILTVEPNAFRGLKTSSSRRQVPQLIPFDEREEKATKDMLVRHTAKHGDRNGELLLFCSSWSKVTSVVIETLKMVTGNPNINLHHARHSAANMAALNALSVSPDPWFGPDSNRHDFELTLLGTNGISQRHAWAVSRYLGHAGPNTTFKSYLHFLLDWAGMLIISEEDSSVDPSHRFYVLDALPTLPEIEVQTDESEPQEATFSKVLQAFRLYLRGYNAVDIQTTLMIPDSLLDCILQVIGTKIKKTRLGEQASGIQESAWTRIVAWADKNDFNCKAYGASTKISVTDLLKMVGATSQLLAWKDEHFPLLGWVLRTFRIDASQYDVYGSARVHQGTLELAEAAGFKVVPRPRWAAREGSLRQSFLQIDSVADGPYNTPVDSRISIVFRENASGEIRNRNQLAVLVAAAVLTIIPG
ncbi:MAG: hypothetical protein KJZ92_03160 [Rhodocyclaceae bacterium]|nr:hypothetical protein [Rhodocyclaceae bacterium]